MAEAAISSLVWKIGAILANEATKSVASLLLSRISAMKELMTKDITEIKDELESMQYFLQIAERLKEKDESTKIVIKQTRDLAFDIEDIIDEFTYKLGEEQGGVLPTAIKRCKNIITWHHLSKRLKEIKIKLQNIMDRRTRYDTKGMENEARQLIAVGGSKCHAESAHFVEKDDIVGIDKYRDLLLGWLKHEDEQQRQHVIISVLGMGGLGKTTLVTKIKELPRSIGKLQNLQILDIDKSEIEKLPKGITKLQKLSRLVLSDNLALTGIWRLKGLQSLPNITATTKIVRNVEALTELRIFGIRGVRTHHCADLWNSITKMNHLNNLFVKSEHGQELQQLGILRLPPPIQELYLEGKLDKKSLPELAASFGSLTNLTALTLSSAKLDEDTFPHLQALPALMLLELLTAYDGMKLHFQATSFPKLKELLISNAWKLNQIKIERGAMANLNVLNLNFCSELKELPHGIEYLTTLQDLTIYRPAEELIERLLGEGEGDHSNDCRTRVRHIPNFTILFERDSKLVKERIQ